MASFKLPKLPKDPVTEAIEKATGKDSTKILPKIGMGKTLEVKKGVEKGKEQGKKEFDKVLKQPFKPLINATKKTSEDIKNTPVTVKPLPPSVTADNPFGIERPTLQSAIGADGKLKGMYSLGTPGTLTSSALSFNGPSINDMEAARTMRERGMATGPSAWLTMQQQQGELDKLKQLESMKAEQAGSMASARGALAMRGGMSTGARERLAAGGTREGMRAAQNIYGQQAQQGMQYSLQDEQMKQAMLQQAAGLEADLGKYTSGMNYEAARQNESNRFAADQTNLNNLMSARGADIATALGGAGMSGMNASAMQQYQDKLKAASSSELAKAMANSGKVMDPFTSSWKGITGGIDNLLGKKN